MAGGRPFQKGHSIGVRFEKGHPGGPGRPKGSKDKVPRTIKDMIVKALERKGGVDWLVQQADANPVAFMSLVGKVLPLQITGADGGAIEIRAVERRIVPVEPLKLVSNADD